MTVKYITEITTGTAIKINDDGTYEGQAMRYKHTNAGEFVEMYKYKFTTPKTMREKMMIEGIIDDAFPEDKDRMMDILLPGY